MSRQDHFTSTVDGAAAFERHHGQEYPSRAGLDYSPDEPRVLPWDEDDPYLASLALDEPAGDGA